jgi:hypothetical protein
MWRATCCCMCKVSCWASKFAGGRYNDRPPPGRAVAATGWPGQGSTGQHAAQLLCAWCGWEGLDCPREAFSVCC